MRCLAFIRPISTQYYCALIGKIGTFEMVYIHHLFLLMCSLILPISVSYFIASQYARHSLENELEVTVEELLYFSKKKQKQIEEALKTLEDSELEPCSPANIRLMGTMDLSYDEIGTIGFIRNNKLLCTAYGMEPSPLQLPTPNQSSAKDIHVWSSVTLSVAGEKPVILVSSLNSGYTAILQKSLPETGTPYQQQLRKGILDTELTPLFSSDQSLELGAFNEISQYSTSSKFHVVEYKDFITGIKNSQVSHIIAYAAIPIAFLQNRTFEFCLYISPLTVVAIAGIMLFLLQRNKQQQSLSSMIAYGLRNNEFRLVYQPVVELDSGRWCGAEALIRWRRPSGEYIAPNIFIPAAEQSGQITEITQRVLELARNDFKDILHLFPEFYLSLNLSSLDVATPSLLEDLVFLKKFTGAGPGRLVVEATERGLLEEDVSRHFFHQIHQYDFLIAIDDFGTGYSSLSYLESFEMDILKIDRAFTRKISPQDESNSIVHHIINMAHGLNLKIIAEGVESQIQADYLIRKGVKYAQGWLYSKPISLDDLVNQLTNQCFIHCHPTGCSVFDHCHNLKQQESASFTANNTKH